MFVLQFDEEDGGRTTEGWVKHDLENGSLDTYWMGNAASDAVSDSPDPVAYLRELLAHVNVSDADKVEALIHALAQSARDGMRG